MSREQLIEDNMKLVYFIIRKYYPTFSQNEDVIQEGMVGLVKAADTWDESKSKFSTYAAACILTEVRMYFRKQSKHQNILSLDKVLPAIKEEGSCDTLGAIIEDELAYLDYEVLEDEEFINTLNDLDKGILGYHRRGFKQTEIADIFGINRNTVNRRLRNIKRIWRKTNGTD